MLNLGAISTLRQTQVVRPEDATPTPLSAFPLEEQILVALAHQPWASASNLAMRLDRSESEIHKACRKLATNRDIAGRRMGVIRRTHQRYVLSRQGVEHVTKPFRYKDLLRPALPLTWQMTEEGVTKMLLWLPMVECLYEILPIFWTCGLAKPFQWESADPDPACSNHVWLGVPTLTEVRWLPSGRLHAVATWTFERYPKRPRSYSIPFFWSGLLPQQEYKDRSLRLGSQFINCRHRPGDAVWWDIEPPVVAVGKDELAAFRARTAYGDDVKVGSVDTSGTLAWCADASHSEWTAKKFPKPKSIGHPEAAASEEGPDMVNLGGIREYRILEFLAEFRAATTANLVEAFHMSRGAVKAAVEVLADRDLITTVGKNSYTTEKGLELLAARDRVDVTRLVEVTYPDPEGEDAMRERRHDAAVASVAAAFRGAGIPASAGWRWLVSWHGGQLVPDLWVRIPVPGREVGIWVPVEVEFSAKTEKRIEKEKLRSYRLAPIRLGKPFPILVITGEELAAKRFDDLAGDLVILATTLKEFLTGVWEGRESVWRRKGSPVGFGEITQAYWDHLQQPTGQPLDYSKPTAEVWRDLLREELITTAPWNNVLDRELPSAGPRVGEEMDRKQNAGKAEPSTSKTVSVPMQRTPSPTPARKEAAAQDCVPQKPPAPPSPAPEPVKPLAAAEDRTRQRWEQLSKINPLIAEADRLAVKQSEKPDLTNVDRLCLYRVRAIINYGEAQHNGVDERRLEQIVEGCLVLKEQHEHAVRSGNALWLRTTAAARTDPKVAFRGILKEHRKTRGAACKTFNQWANMVDRAVRAARRDGTLE